MTIPLDHIFSGRKMKTARKAAKLSLWRLSALLARKGEYITPMHLSRIEAGRYVPRARVFICIAHFVKRKPEDLFTAARPSDSWLPRKRKRA